MKEHLSTYQDILGAELTRRLRSNARYSLRAFARDLEMDPGRLSRILNGKEGLSKESAQNLAKKLALNKEESQWFCALVQSQNARSRKNREEAKQELSVLSQKDSEVKILEEDLFAVISDWWHYAILELCSLSGFKSDPAWISRKLDIPPSAAKFAIDRLLRLGLVNRKNGRLEQTDLILSTTNNIPSASIRSFHKQMLERAISAIELQSVEERDFSNLTIAVSQDDIPWIKEQIKNFRRSLNAQIEKSSKNKKKSEVYSINFQVFRLTTKESSK